jgi:hypothetical protein
MVCIGPFGTKAPFHAGEQAERIQNGEKIERLRMTSQQNDFLRSISRHLMTTEVLEQLVKYFEGIDTDATDEDEDAEDDVEKVGEDREGTSTGTAVTASPQPKNTVTVEIGEAYKTPIVYQSGNNSREDVLLRVNINTVNASYSWSVDRVQRA